MKNLSVKLKMTIIGMMVVVFMLFSIEFSVSGMRAIDERILQEEADNIRKDYDDSIKQQVAQVISLLETYQAEIEAGTYTREEGMKQAADKVRALRYGVDGYFWVDLSDGTNVVLLGNDIEGTNRLGTEDVTGFRMVKDFIEGAVAQGSYYCDYQYPKEGGTEPMPKRAYTEYFEPFDWVVGTGNYIDNIDAQINASKETAHAFTNQKIKTFITVCIVFAIVIILCLWITILNITKPLHQVGEILHSMSGGDFSVKIDERTLKRRDDFGRLSNILEKMRVNIGGLIHDVKEETTLTTESVNGISENMVHLNTKVEDVSSTTTQLSASMDVTAATAGSINEMTKEIEYAAKNIAERAQAAPSLSTRRRFVPKARLARAKTALCSRSGRLRAVCKKPWQRSRWSLRFPRSQSPSWRLPPRPICCHSMPALRLPEPATPEKALRSSPTKSASLQSSHRAARKISKK